MAAVISSCKLTLVGETKFTNWGTTDRKNEPLDGNECVALCFDDNDSNCDGSWRVEDCTSELNFVCQVQCNKALFANSICFQDIFLQINVLLDGTPKVILATNLKHLSTKNNLTKRKVHCIVRTSTMVFFQ